MIEAPSRAPSRAPRSNPIRSRADWEAQRQAFLADPGAFQATIARSAIHWYDAALNAWITWDEATNRWVGCDAKTGAAVDVAHGADHQPWQRTFNDDTPPHYRWFEGGLTNACFNEVDRHVLMGFGDDIAFVFEGDRWDNSLNGGRGGPVHEEKLTRKQLLFEVVKATLVLKNLGLKQGDRIALNMPNILEQIYYTEAAKRLGIVYTPVFGGFSDKTLSDRIHNAGARIVITSDGAYRNAQIVPYKEVYTDQALDKFIPIEMAIAIVQETLTAQRVDAAHGDKIVTIVKETIAEDITVERSDVMRGVGKALQELGDLDVTAQSQIRTAIARALVASHPRVDAVVVVRHTGQDILWRAERDRWSHDLIAEATKQLLEAAAAHGQTVANEEELAALPVEQLYPILASIAPCTPVDAEYPMFIIYTSGSTGKPKGVVHVHGGYIAGLVHTMKVSFDAEPGDTILVVADPGWITGQSYMLSATMASRCTGVLVEGSPVFPSAGRFASIIERNDIQIFKAGVTFLKSVMTNPQNVADVQQYDMSSLRVCTFCAEPVSPSVQQFGMEVMSPQYINSYWATEHGGIVWTHFYGNDDYPLRPDAHTYPLPWVTGDVWVSELGADGTSVAYRLAEQEEKGEIVITTPYPYLTRTIWGDVEGFERVLAGEQPLTAWNGDAERFSKTYWRRGPNDEWAYVQGDFAMRYGDGSFTLHGRSDDVINVSGHRMGTEEIEGAILRDKQTSSDSPVGNCIVVGAPHREKGLTPVAFVLTAPGRRLSSLDRKRLDDLVRNEKGIVAVPEDYIEVDAFPETRSGKYMRRFLRSLMLDEDLGDTSTLRNPEALDEIRVKIDEWKRKQKQSDEQKIFERYRYFRIEYHKLNATQRQAIVTITNPPVNALNERALDELNTIVDHLSRREDIAAVIFTGQGTKSFVAGADIRQLLEDMNTFEDAIALPNNAHLAFRKIERMSKPCVAAINGVALGGGLEFALACHYRVADQHAEFGQPEINLRMLPGYGGTQRLPRLLYKSTAGTGSLRALELILGGRTLPSDEAHEIGLIERLATGTEDALSVASALVREYMAGSGVLKEAFEGRKQALTAWEQPNPEFVKDELNAIIQNPRVQRILNQSEGAGRKDAVARALEAIVYGFEHGFEKGLEHEAKLFAEAVVDPEGGKKGIQDFMDKRSAPLPTRRPLVSAEQEKLYRETKQLLPIGSPFFPGVTAIPTWQYAKGVIRDPVTGEDLVGDPKDCEREVIIPVETPNANEALLYILSSEVNFNDIWAITGIPISLFDEHDRDWHITGSGGVALVAAVGDQMRQEGRIKVGDMVAVYSGQSNMLSPMMGLDPMAADFFIQGYNTPDGSHQQFMIAQAPQCLPLAPDMSLEAAGSFMLNLGTAYRALFTTLAIKSGKSVFIEGAATGTGLDAARSAARSGLRVIGMVSSEDRAKTLIEAGGKGAVNRKDPSLDGIFTRIPPDPAEWAAWEKAGEPLLNMFRQQNNHHLADYAISHAGEQAFARSFQLLGEPRDGHIPTLTFYGASSGYHFTFLGKPGHSGPEEMMRRAGLRGGQAVLIYYGVEDGALVDEAGLEAVEAARSMGARIVVATYTDAQREFVLSLGFGASLRGVVSIEELQRRYGEDFDWPKTMPDLPDSKTDPDGLKEAIRRFNDLTFKPLGSAIGTFLVSADNPRGYPDMIIERAGHDSLNVSAMLVKPFIGRIVYFEEMGGKRFSFFAPQIWMRQRRIYMPTANLWGTHLSNAYEILRLLDEISAGMLAITEPMLVDWKDLEDAHQAIWENRHAGATYAVNHALPRAGIKSKDELYEAWAELL
ncbi:MAG: acetyl-CoA synthetase [Candidatus Viridilinea halotolerans]|uniref:acetate--CoA ligase n=1 Tax=Candidatus Viridilinea halotolerans TaxID=2491704 RepID=A0A426U035_9CHLR|nr:MAG: acetyl-CoA synthetase [Candidatus Viridilinea halotolerans]